VRAFVMFGVDVSFFYVLFSLFFLCGMLGFGIGFRL
jgi:hypothetical protein